MRELQELVKQLKADNERLRQEQSQRLDATAGSSTLSTEPPPSSVRSNPGVDRLVFIPRDRKCPMFCGRTGIGLSE